MSIDEVSSVIEVFQNRYAQLKDEKCIKYILLFHNHGELAGASISHPHSQLIALPIIPPDVARSLSGSERFFKKNRKCVHCAMIAQERREKKRIVFENKYFISVAPYASRVSYEIRIFPKRHESYFEDMLQTKRSAFAEALIDSLARISKVLGNPNFNFFIHTSPINSINKNSKIEKNKKDFYHWHLEILPRTSKWAGVELGTGIEVTAISPEEAAEKLRKSIRK